MDVNKVNRIHGHSKCLVCPSTIDITLDQAHNISNKLIWNCLVSFQFILDENEEPGTEEECELSVAASGNDQDNGSTDMDTCE